MVHCSKTVVVQFSKINPHGRRPSSLVGIGRDRRARKTRRKQDVIAVNDSQQSLPRLRIGNRTSRGHLRRERCVLKRNNTPRSACLTRDDVSTLLREILWLSVAAMLNVDTHSVGGFCMNPKSGSLWSSSRFLLSAATLAILAGAALVLVQCSSVPSSGTGSAQVSFSDPAPCSSGSNGPYEHMYVMATAVQAHQSSSAGPNSPGWVTLTPSAMQSAPV
jgi:hypothetical protein